MSRIAELTVDHLNARNGQPYLLVDGHRTVLPPRLATLLTTLACTGRPGSMAEHAITGTRWLFPGLLPGRPISAAALRVSDRWRLHAPAGCGRLPAVAIDGAGPPSLLAQGVEAVLRSSTLLSCITAPNLRVEGG